VDTFSTNQIQKLLAGLKGNCGWINLTIQRALLTRDTEVMGKMDPYVKWKHGEKTYKTTVQNNAGKKPIWGEIFKLPIIDRTINTQLSFQIFDEETFKDDVIGEAKIDIH